MPEQSDITHYYPVMGSESVRDPKIVNSFGYDSSVNTQLKGGHVRTRYGIRQVKLACQDPDFYSENIQGCITHNPAKGQSGQVFSRNKTYIMAAVGGKKYAIDIKGSGQATIANAVDVSGGIITDKNLHLVYWLSAENYALANDGRSDLMIWDSEGSMFVLGGYDVINKEESKLPNGGTVMVYAHGRIGVVINSRYIIFGDIIHKDNNTNASNLLSATEQTYWATGTYLMPPSNMGDIQAAAILALKNTTHGHSDIIFHCADGGQFSANVNIHPREAWSDTEMTRHAMLHTSATGPYAVDLVDGDQVFRSRRSVDTLRSAALESEIEGAPSNPIGEKIQDYLNSDFGPFLKFASLNMWTKENRLLCTAEPVVRKRFYMHRSIVAKNMDPTITERAPAAWESVVILPKGIDGVVQLVNGMFAGEERQFAFVRDERYPVEDGENKLVEFDPALHHDVILNDDGTETVKDISCSLISRAVHFNSPLTYKKLFDGKIFFSDIWSVEGQFLFGVWIKTDKQKNWKYWGGQNVNIQYDEESLPAAHGKDLEWILGDPNVGICRWAQVLVQWTGAATFESMLLKSDPTAIDWNTKITAGDFSGPLEEECCEYSPMEYSTKDKPSWHERVAS